MKIQTEDQLRTAFKGRWNTLSPKEQVAALRAIHLARIRAWKCNVQDFVEGLINGEEERLLGAIGQFGEQTFDQGWRAAMRAITRLGSVPEHARQVFLLLCTEYGPVSGYPADNDVFKGLRVLLPPYTGAAVRLYRGQNPLSHRRRDYGLSWSASRDVADSFAQAHWQRLQGGSVVLETLAPPEAVICRVPPGEDRYGEDEYLVDRRRLHRVRVIARYPQRSSFADRLDKSADNS